MLVVMQSDATPEQLTRVLDAIRELDLTPHPHGAPRVDESVWLAKHRPPHGRTDRYVIVGVITGNRPTPHEL